MPSMGASRRDFGEGWAPTQRDEAVGLDAIFSLIFLQYLETVAVLSSRFLAIVF